MAQWNYKKLQKLKAVKAVDEGRKVTYQMISDHLGKSRSHTIALFRGEVKNPRLEDMQALAEYFGVSVLELLEEVNKKAHQGLPSGLSHLETAA